MYIFNSDCGVVWPWNECHRIESTTVLENVGNRLDVRTVRDWEFEEGVCATDRTCASSTQRTLLYRLWDLLLLQFSPVVTNIILLQYSLVHLDFVLQATYSRTDDLLLHHIASSKLMETF